MKAVVSNRIFLDYTPDIAKKVKEELTFTLPPAMPGGRPRVMKMYNTIGKVFSLPVGCASMIPDNFTVKDLRVESPTVFPDFSFELRPDQKEIYDAVDSSCLINANPSWGKAQPGYSKIRVADGWTTMADIKIGDTLITPTNTKAKVTGKFAHKDKRIYTVTLNDGRQVDACGEHLWEVYLGKDKGTQIINTLDMVKYLQTHAEGRLYIPLCKPISDTKKQYKLHPYVLGMLIGDGGFTTTATVLSTADQFILDRIASLLPEGHTMNHASAYDYRIVGDGKVNKVGRALASMGLQGLKGHQKFIPDEYKYGSLEDKLQMIQGLFDADGSVEKNAASFEFTTTSKRLMDDVCSIIYSLGGTGTIQTRQTYYTYKGEKKAGRISYRMRPSRLSLELKLQMFCLPRKRDRIKAGAYDNTGKIKVESVTYKDNQDCFCISIDSKDKTYLTDNYVVTHNTFCAIAIAAKLGQKTLVICHNTILRDQWQKEIKKTLGIDCGVIGSGKTNHDSPITVSNIQTLRNHARTLASEFGTVIVDEVHRAPAKIFSSTLNELKAKYKIGLSATLERKDGMHFALPLYFSETLYTASRANQMKPEIHIYDLPIKFPGSSMTPWAVRLNEFYENPLYYKFVSEITQVYIKLGHKGLVVADRVAFLEQLEDDFENVVSITGKITDSAERERRLQSVTEDKDVIAGTTSIFKEGVSQNVLSLLVIAVPLNNIPVLEQLIGRVQRKMEGKIQPIVIDIVCQGGTSKRQCYNRAAYYKEQGYKVVLTQLDRV